MTKKAVSTQFHYEVQKSAKKKNGLDFSLFAGETLRNYE